MDDEEEEEEEEQADGSMVMVKKRKKKRRRSQREDEDEEGLDEDDLDLVLENTGHEVDRTSQVRFTRFPTFFLRYIAHHQSSIFRVSSRD